MIGVLGAQAGRVVGRVAGVAARPAEGQEGRVMGELVRRADGPLLVAAAAAAAGAAAAAVAAAARAARAARDRLEGRRVVLAVAALAVAVVVATC